jgi:hypothetical protein
MKVKAKQGFKISQDKVDVITRGFVKYIYDQPFFSRLKFCSRVMLRKRAKVNAVQEKK